MECGEGKDRGRGRSREKVNDARMKVGDEDGEKGKVERHSRECLVALERICNGSRPLGADVVASKAVQWNEEQIIT
jgi:hypothetical protein